MLGFMYEAGEYFKRDVDKAFQLYSEASQTGNTRAKIDLAKLYHLGIGAERDLVSAARLYREAAEAGIPEAQFQLGTALASGKEVRRDLVEASYWLRLASDQGHEHAPKTMKEVARFLTGEEFSEVLSRIEMREKNRSE